MKARDETVLTALSVAQVSGTSPPAPAPPPCCGLTPREPPPGDLLRALLPSPQGYHCRDALAKNIYSRLFDWLVNRINTSIQVSTGHCPPLGSPPLPSRGWDVAQHPAAVSQVKPGKQRKVMGVLDIYGFEIFQVSSRTHLGPSCCWGERGRAEQGWGLQHGPATRGPSLAGQRLRAVHHQLLQ